MNSDQFSRWLRRQGATFEPGKGGHRIVRFNGRTSVVPTHGGRKQLGTGLINKIKKDLGLK
ncbi:MAG: type II toxin-antitoxin system HicA family toxin [Alphaproteobacteria bacterium]